MGKAYITLNVGSRIYSDKHFITSTVNETKTLVMLENMALALRRGQGNVIFKEVEVHSELCKCNECMADSYGY